ncbi:MAG: glycosyltransferase family 4 protein [Chloroflexota bacterium]
MTHHIMVYADRPGIYGAEQCNHILACAFAENSFQTSFVQPIAQHHLIEEREALGVTHHWLEPDDIYDLSQPARTLTNWDEPYKILSETRPDLILFSDSCPFANLKAKQVAIELNIPYVIVVHCVNPEWVNDYADWLDELPEVFNAAQTVIAVSQANLDLLNGMFGLPLDRGTVIYNGRPPEYFEPALPGTRQRIRQELKIPADAIMCLTVARLDFSKGYQYQLDALVELKKRQKLDNLHFVWVGHGYAEDRIKRMVKLLGMSSQVHFLGARQDVPDLLDSADMFILPSQFEGMPLVILEAMAKGLPVIATEVSGTPEAIGDAGFLLPDPVWGEIAPILANQIRWLAEKPAVRQQMGATARKRAERYFRLETMTNTYLTILHGLLNRQKMATHINE